MLLKVRAASILSLVLINCAFAADKPCAKHTFKVNYLRNCRGKSSNVLVIQNVSFALTDECHLVPRGCYQVKKKVSDVTIDYHVSKPPILNKNGTEDLCKSLLDPGFQQMAAPYKSIDSKCPIEAGQYCISKGSTLIEQLNPSVLNMAVGTIKVVVNMKSEKSKAQACVEMEAIISKKKH